MRLIQTLVVYVLLFFISSNCSNMATTEEQHNKSWLFVANEGIYDFTAPTNSGTISMINSFGEIFETEPLGDIVHSLAIYNDKLIVAVNNSQKILLFDI